MVVQLMDLMDLTDCLLVMMSDNLFMARMASTHLAHFLRAWNCLSFTVERTSRPTFCSIRKGCSRHWLAVSLFLPLLLSRWEMKSLAFSDIGSNSGSSKSKRTLAMKMTSDMSCKLMTYLTMLLKVSASLSPMKGEKPERRM